MAKGLLAQVVKGEAQAILVDAALLEALEEQGVAVDGAGAVYVADAANQAIRKISRPG